MIEIKSFANINFDVLFTAFEQAFAEYEVQQDKVQLQRMLKRRGFNPNLSFAAFEGDKIVAFTFNGIGNYYGVRTAYDTGTGTLKEYRGKGLATRIFEYSIPYLKEAGIQQYLLEVLQHNTKAVSVYRNIGFEVIREFNYFVEEKEKVCIPLQVQNSVSPYIIKEINIADYLVSDFWDFCPSWQNSFEAISRVPDVFITLGIFAEDILLGYCIFESQSGDITQIAVDKGCRRKGIGTLLFEEVTKLINSNQIKIINTELSCDAITRFLGVKKIAVKGKQFEMIKKL